MKSKLTKILLLEHNANDVKLLENELHKCNFQFEDKVVSNKAEFVNALDTYNPDIIISEYTLPSFDSKEALAIVRATLKNAPFILLTSKPENNTDRMMNEGAYDYLLKDDLHLLPLSIMNALQKYKFNRKKDEANEKMLKETESLAHIGSWQFNFKTLKGKWSDEAYRLLGYEPGEVTPKLESYLERVHPSDLEFVQKEVYKVEKGKLPANKFEHRIIDFKTREVKYLQTKVIAEYKKGKLLRVSGFNRDITTEKLAQLKLLQSQAHLLASQRIAHIGSWEANLLHGNNIIDNQLKWSDETYRIFGLNPNEFTPTINKSLEYVHPDDRELLLKKYTDSRENCKAYNHEYRIIRPDGLEKIVQSRGEIIKDELTGKALKMLGTLQDITERKEEEQALNRSNAKIRTIFDNTDITYILVNRDLKVVSFNKLALESFSRELAMTMQVGDNILDFIAPDRKQRALDMYKRVFDGEKFALEDSYVLKDGSTFWYHMQLLPIYGDDNKVFKMIISFRDITDKKTAEIEREKITADLIQRNRDLEQFSYIISHNLRLPVANIMGLIDNFEINKLPDEEQRDTISAIYISVRALDDVILDLNRILGVRNNAKETKQTVKFSDIAHENNVALGFAIKKENVIIDTDFSEIDELLTIKSYLSSIFYNLVLNSIKFRQPSLSPHIKISSKKLGNKIILTFSDNGSGIDLCKNGKELFGLYKRFHHNINGKGTGLYMVKCQVEAMGGKISAVSQVNKGTTFTIEFEG